MNITAALIRIPRADRPRDSNQAPPLAKPNAAQIDQGGKAWIA